MVRVSTGSVVMYDCAAAVLIDPPPMTNVAPVAQMTFAQVTWRKLVRIVNSSSVGYWGRREVGANVTTELRNKNPQFTQA